MGFLRGDARVTVMVSASRGATKHCQEDEYPLHDESAERFAVQRSGRRQAGAVILRRCLCGDQISQLKVVEEKDGDAPKMS